MSCDVANTHTVTVSVLAKNYCVMHSNSLKECYSVQAITEKCTINLQQCLCACAVWNVIFWKETQLQCRVLYMLYGYYVNYKHCIKQIWYCNLTCGTCMCSTCMRLLNRVVSYIVVSCPDFFRIWISYIMCCQLTVINGV